MNTQTEENTETQYIPIKKFNKYFNDKLNEGECSEGHREQSHFNLYFFLLSKTMNKEKEDYKEKKYVKMSKGIINEMMTHLGDRIFTMREEMLRGSSIVYMLCEYTNNFEIIQWFLDLGGDPNIQNDDDFTPLHKVINDGIRKKNIVKLLLEKGGNPMIRNYCGETSFHLLKQWENFDDIDDVLSVMIKHIKPGGYGYIFGGFTTDDIDVIVRFRNN